MHKYAHKKFCLFLLKKFMKNKKLFACFTEKKTSQNFIYLLEFEGKNAFSVYKPHLYFFMISSAVCLQFSRSYVLPEETGSVILLF